MLGWAVTFLVIAMIGAVFGFSGLAVASTMQVAQVIFFVFIVLFALAMIVRAMRGRPPV